MKYLFLLSFLLVYCFFGLELGYTATSPAWKHVTYIFQHASVIHLLMNSFAFWTLSVALYRFVPEYKVYAISITVAVLASFVCTYSKVVVGASGMIYAMLGMYFFLVAVGKIRFKNKIALVVSILSVIIFLTISFLKQNSAGMLHLLCLCGGLLSTSLLSLLSPSFPFLRGRAKRMGSKL